MEAKAQEYSTLYEKIYMTCFDHGFALQVNANKHAHVYACIHTHILTASSLKGREVDHQIKIACE